MLQMRFNIAKRIIAKLRTKVNSGFDVFADRKRHDPPNHNKGSWPMKKINTIQRMLIIVLCLCMMLPLSACGETKESQRQVFAMDTIMTLTAYGNKAESGLSAAESVILSMDAMLDPDLETSTTYAINNANGTNVSISGQVAKMLNTAHTVYLQSNGALDLTLFPVF